MQARRPRIRYNRCAKLNGQVVLIDFPSLSHAGHEDVVNSAREKTYHRNLTGATRCVVLYSTVLVRRIKLDFVTGEHIHTYLEVMNFFIHIY